MLESVCCTKNIIGFNQNETFSSIFFIFNFFY